MSGSEFMMKVSSNEFSEYTSAVISKLWGSDINAEESFAFLQQIKELLRRQNIETVTQDDINLIIVSTINKVFMTPLDYMELFITEDCNLRCHYCFVRKKSQNRMPPKVAFEAIDFFVMESRDKKTLNITLFGGEPLLEFSLIREIVQYAENIANLNGKKISFNMTTNGTLFTEEILSFSQGKIAYLISIDGDKITHDKHRRTIDGKGSYDLIMNSLPLVKRYQHWLGARMTVYPDTVDKLADNLDFLYSKGFNQFIIGPSYGPKWDDKAFATYEDQMNRISRFYIEKTKNKEPFRMNFFESKNNERFCKTNTWGCRAGRNGITVSAEGGLYPCSKFLGLSGLDKGSFCLGHIATGITKLDIRDELVSLNTEQFTECIDCEAIDYCTGGCPANNYHDRGIVSKPSPFDCAIAKINRRVIKMFEEEKCLDLETVQKLSC